MEIAPKKISDIFNIQEVGDRNYWFVRTSSGKFYQDFVLHDYIAIGWDFISISDFNSTKINTVKAMIKQNLALDPDNENVTDTKKKKGEITGIYNKIKRFIKEFTLNDVVVIPDVNSENYSIGIITSDVFEDSSYIKKYLDNDPDTEMNLCPYAKRRSVTWLKTISKRNADIYLLKALGSQHAISDVKEYAPYINRNLYDIYSSEGKLHAIIRAGTDEKSISFSELKQLVDLIENELKRADANCNLDDLTMKLNIHSAGIIELIAGAGGLSLVLGTAMFSLNHLINGGKTSMDFKLDENGLPHFSVSSESPGLRGRELEKIKLEYEHQEKILKLSSSLNLQIPQVQLTDEIENPVKEDIE